MSDQAMFAVAVVIKYVLLLLLLCLLIVGLVFIVSGFGTTLIDLPDLKLGELNISKSKLPLGIVIVLVAAILMFITMKFLKIEFRQQVNDAQGAKNVSISASKPRGAPKPGHGHQA